jgi:hypothetical protein
VGDTAAALLASTSLAAVTAPSAAAATAARFGSAASFQYGVVLLPYLRLTWAKKGFRIVALLLIVQSTVLPCKEHNSKQAVLAGAALPSSWPHTPRSDAFTSTQQFTSSLRRHRTAP